MAKIKSIIISTGASIGAVCVAGIEHLDSNAVTLRQYESWENIRWPSTGRLMVVSEIDALPSQKPKTPRDAKHLLFADKDVSIESLSRITKLDIRDDRRLHIATRDDDAEWLIYRTVSGFAENNEDRVIDAWWDKDNFVILTPDFDRLIIPRSKLSRFLGDQKRIHGDFEIDHDGSYVYWSRADVHLGLEQFACMTNEMALRSVKTWQKDFNRNYGIRIKSLRKQFALRQSDIRGLTSRQVARIEKGECRTTSSALEKLAIAHGLDLREYLDALANHA